jgi:hypothetical protein
MQIDLRATSYPGLLEAVGLAIVHCDGMERAIPSVFRAALDISLTFQRRVFDATRGLEAHLKLTEAAVLEGAPQFHNRWKELATRVRSSAYERGRIAHAGMSIYGGGIAIEIDEQGIPTGNMKRQGRAVASLRKGDKNISEVEIRQLADRVLDITTDIGQLAADITVHRLPR